VGAFIGVEEGFLVGFDDGSNVGALVVSLLGGNGFSLHVQNDSPSLSSFTSQEHISLLPSHFPSELRRVTPSL
jgi:hypothetical protein